MHKPLPWYQHQGINHKGTMGNKKNHGLKIKNESDEN